VQFESWEDAVKKARAKAEEEATSEEDSDAAVVPRPLASGSSRSARWSLHWKVLAIALGILFAFAQVFVAYLFFAGSSPGDPPRTKYPATPAYAEEALLAKYKAEGVLDKPDDTEEIRASKRRLRDLYADVASDMPTDRDSRIYLDRMLEYFHKEDIIGVWMNCRDGAQPFAAVGTTPKDILWGAIETMERLGIQRRAQQSLREFVALYTSFREYDRLTHQETIDKIISLRKFEN
jgi:hypothetical protein